MGDIEQEEQKKMTVKFKRVISHLYIAMLTAAFVLTVLDSRYWWLLVLTYFTMRFVANLIEKEENKYAKIQSHSNHKR